MVKIVQINRDNAGFFAGLDPLSVMDRTPMVPQMILGAAVSSEDSSGDGSDTPVGLVVVGVYQTALVIFWLYVDPKYRGQGIGEMLLEDVFSAAVSSGKKSVAALLGNEYGRDFVCPYEREYLSYQGFSREMSFANGNRTVLVADLTEDGEISVEGDFGGDTVSLSALFQVERESGREDEDLASDLAGFDDLSGLVLLAEERELTDEDLVVSVKEIAASEMLTLSEKDKAMMMPNVVSISDLPLPQLYETLKKCLKVHPYAFDGEITDHPVTWFEPRLSCCYLVDDEVVGLFLVHREQDKFWTEYAADLSDATPEHIYKMIKYVSDIFVKSATPQQTVVIRRHNQDIRGITERVFGK